jgi:hypothetical protein
MLPRRRIRLRAFDLALGSEVIVQAVNVSSSAPLDALS